ncbi:UNVERIFIED_CONTAM: hypothetical protein Sangu_1306600 [Sesamum angustifolium]|uniref:ATP-dependent DNA helicase n=1 Tax=Sesamum angustifolium TaxID=2727405 RepID=A0AAW2NJM6_9LAMI
MDEESLHYPLFDDYHVTFGIPLDIQALEHQTSHDKDENQVNFDFSSEDINNSTPKVFGFGRLAKIGESPWCLPDAPVCMHCGAKKFHREPPGFCCSNGQVSLSALNVPNELRDLFFGSSQMCLHFKANSRTYNNAFAFTSFGVTYDKELCRNEKNIYTFRVQGLVYHFLNDLIPKEGKGTNLQLYFHDIENEVDNRLAVSDKLKQELVLMIMKLLEVNPYSFFFRSLREIPELHDYKIILRADPGLDQRIYNVPTVDQVAAIWKDSDECEESQSRDIRVYPKSGRSKKIEYYYGCYDPLQYPLLFPRGEPGWHVGIKRKKLSERIGSQKRMRLCEVAEKFSHKRETISAREYYCYRLQMRAGDKSILLHSNRLLQQYVNDMYIKGKYHDTFRDAAASLGLLDSDNSLEEYLEEASQYQMPYSLRRLFSTILMYCSPANPTKLWENLNLICLKIFVGKINLQKEYNHERKIEVSEADLLSIEKLNDDQRHAFNIITEKIYSSSSGTYFIDGPGGSGKTFLYRALLADVRSRGYIALAVATSGVAAALLPGGRTNIHDLKYL